MKSIEIDVDSNGIAVLRWNMLDRSTNVLNESSLTDYADLVDKVLSDQGIKGAIISSLKSSFIVGADLDWILRIGQNETSQLRHARSIYQTIMQIHALFRRGEQNGKPFVAAINGSALGGGYEVALACRYRIAVNDPDIRIGLPEARLGLIPGGGGIQRLTRMLGPANALPILSEGKIFGPQEALKNGLIDEIVDPNELIPRAKDMITAFESGDWLQPWDNKGFQVPGPDPRTATGSVIFAMINALQRKKTYGNYPAIDAIYSAVYRGLNVPFDTALKIEAEQFSNVVTSDVARALVRTRFKHLQRAKKLEARPKEIAPAPLKKIGVLGAGMMGAGICHVAAKAGIEVVVIDRDQQSAGMAVSHIRSYVTQEVASGRTNDNAIASMLARIKPSTNFADLDGAELVIEAVFENSDVKADVIRRAEAVIGSSAIFATNTSTIPISQLALNSRRPSQFIGMHFFSPVERMELVELIKGEKTGNSALAVAMDFVKRISKTSIVVNDSRGFYTSRVFNSYTAEGWLMVSEGIKPALIENAGRMAGMAVGPLAASDEVGLDLIHHVNLQTAKDLGSQFQFSPGHNLIKRMVEEDGRAGKKVKKGFYEYPASAKKFLWPELEKYAVRLNPQPDVNLVKRRLLVIQALEASRCLESGVLSSPADADVGALLGWAFAPWTGGPLSYVDMIGASQFLQWCNELAASFGSRFDPPQLIRELARTRSSFYNDYPTYRAA